MIFVDTGVWFEAEVGADAPGEASRALLAEHHGEVATSAAVLTELWNLVAVRRWPQRATQACLDVAASSSLLLVDRHDHERALAVLATWADQTFSYADASSFVLAERDGIETMASFDDHFRVYRYGPNRTRAFHVIP